MKQGARSIRGSAGMLVVGALVALWGGAPGCASDEPGTTKSTKVTTVDGPTEKTTTTEKHEKKVEYDR
jgi:hypothetical protein